MKLYGLFYYIYGYLGEEVEFLECVSHCRGKLEEELHIDERLAETCEQHESLAVGEFQHYYIKEVRVI